MSTTVVNKGHRLFWDGHVAELPVQAFAVRGDHATYTVVLNGSTEGCSCPARTRCSHIHAARLHARARRAPLAGVVKGL